MKCPYCGNACPEGALYCDVCKQPLPTEDDRSAHRDRAKPQREPRSRRYKIIVALCWIACFIALCVGAYKLVSWYESYKITRLYTRGAYTPTVNALEMSDGRDGHALIFYGEDGDLIYLPELDRCLSICGGVARLEIADADWFNDSVSDYEYVDISFAPVLIHADGSEVRLPIVKYSVDAPVSPLTITSPAKERPTVVTSTYPITMQVVYGSSVYINGEDLTDQVARDGALSINVNVLPIGDNTYTVIVRTPQHKETRQDIVLYRQQFDIEIELDAQVSTSSSSETMPVSGTCEPGAVITVDTDYIPESLMIDMTTGQFSFIAKFSQLGANVVRFRASMEGRSDAVISFSVNYKPTLAQYTQNEWKMDYDQLRLYFEQWSGRVFRCKGPILDIFTEGDITYMVMNVSTDSATQQLVVLQNQTSITAPSMGPSYTAHADVAGRYLYNAQYYPMLIARYMDLTASS